MLDLRGTPALVLLHLQNGIVDPRGSVGAHLTRAMDMTAVLDAAEAARSLADDVGVPTVHVVFESVDGSCITTSKNLRQGAAAGFGPGEWESQVPGRLQRPHDLVLPHSTMSGFAATTLADDLRGRGVDHVVIGGVSTHLVVAATAFAAADEGFDVTVAEDCCGAPDGAVHRAALDQIAVIGTVAASFAEAVRRPG